MTGFALSPAAQTDLDDIWDYTAQRWGLDQAETYIRNIQRACHGLVDGTSASQAVDIRSGYRKCSAGAHLLFFTTNDDGSMSIMRILHQRMDATLHL